MRLLRWMLFSVLVALIPLLLRWVALLSQYMGVSNASTLVLARGELLLISTAIAADAIGDLVASSQRNRSAKILAAGFCVLSLLFSALWYATNSTIIDMGGSTNARIVAVGSVVVFVVTILAGGSCKWLAME